MDKVLYLLGPLSCAVMMGAMMWTMRRHRMATATPVETDAQRKLAELRAEIAALRAGTADVAPPTAVPATVGAEPR